MNGPSTTSDRPKPREGSHRDAVADEVNYRRLYAQCNRMQ